MCFKCVSKTWLSLIEEDLLLVKQLSRLDRNNLHENRKELILTANLSKDNSRGEIQKIRKLKSSRPNEILGPVHGFICLVDKLTEVVRVYNLSTRERTPSVRSRLRRVQPLPGFSLFKTYQLGYDPTTKIHKILSVRYVYRQHGQNNNYPGDLYVLCDVLTIGDNAWRRIDEVPPCFGIGFTSVYLNGYIYYCTTTLSTFTSGNPGNSDIVLVAFDLGSEKFRMIRIPEFILNSPPSEFVFNQHANLLEVDGHVAIACRMSAYIVKLWVCREDNKGKKTTNANFCNVEENWTEDTILLPLPFDWDPNIHWGFYTGVGTHQILVRSTHWSDSGIKCTLYSYDLQKKSFTKIHFHGIPSSIRNGCNFKVSTFAESLLPIQKQRSSSGEPHSNIQQ
ncbi:hypothetical protein MKW98_029469 [Papaver atlanticum]|uniref:F-box associated beta-propeller type 3 domain-containing protein n=1 Tax=Papaver atlanticum TaxID=357466 RepID=A0AAD4SHZ5_9MAGN|nr:hypothetical protein MKW98_029469 [Papaver atlanticum]